MISLLKIKKEAGWLNAAEENQLQTAENHLQRDRERYVTAARFQSRFAKIYCTSGLGASGGGAQAPEDHKSGWILDWGLAELCRSRFPTFDGLSSALNAEAILHFIRFEKDSAALTNQGGIVSHDELETRVKLNKYTATKDGSTKDTANKHVVFKCGRTTGKTRGELNNIYASVRMRYEIDGGREIVVQGKALVVVSPVATSRLWAGGNGCPIVFGDKGDSGSLVFDYQGKVVGMYIGGQSPLCARAVNPDVKASSVDGIHFVAPIGPILDDIHAAVRRDTAFARYDGVDVDFMWG